jgi:membrane-bound lytic murein transglycosylase D
MEKLPLSRTPHLNSSVLRWPGRLLFELLFVCLLAIPLHASAQNDAVTLDGLAQSAQEWAKENLDEDVFRALQDVDQEKVKQFFADIQRELQGNYVLDLGTLKETARNWIPVLERYEETSPYAAWLKARLDYLEVAEQLRRSTPLPKAVPGEPPKPAPNPPPQAEREIWIKKLSERSRPKASKPYVPELKPIFIAQNVPPELIWIAEVESSFDPRARSPAGAAGMFQLMPATAKRFGLQVRPFDQRLNPEESATAAAKYLHYLHAHFKDWRLALAAYNSGEGTVEKLLSRHKDKTFDAISTQLPAETQMYVPKVEAVVLRREGLKLNQLEAGRG